MKVMALHERLRRLGLLCSEKNKGDRVKVHEVMSGTDWSGTSVLPVSFCRIKEPYLNYQTNIKNLFKKNNNNKNPKQKEKENQTTTTANTTGKTNKTTKQMNFFKKKK